MSSQLCAPDYRSIIQICWVLLMKAGLEIKNTGSKNHSRQQEFMELQQWRQKAKQQVLSKQEKMKKHDKKDDLQQKKQQCLSIPGAIWIPIAIKHYETLGCGTAYIFWDMTHAERCWACALAGHLIRCNKSKICRKALRFLASHSLWLTGMCSLCWWTKAWPWTVSIGIPVITCKVGPGAKEGTAGQRCTHCRAQGSRGAEG